MIESILQQVVIGISIASVYVLVSIGLTLVFGMMNVLNFTHGVLYALGSYVGYVIARQAGNFWIAVMIAPIVVSLIGVGVEQIAIRRLSDRAHLIQFLATYALTLVLVELIRMVMGNNAYNIAPPPEFSGTVNLGGLSFSSYRLFLIVTAAAVCAALWASLQGTRWGAVIRVASEDSEVAELLGINTRLTSALVFAAGSGLAGLAGVLAAPIFSVHPSIGDEIIAMLFVIVAVGGMGSLPGTIIAALAFGQISSVGVLAFGPYADVLALVAMGAILLVKPNGLFAKPRHG
jgi:branched-subunit amino acid ABC-type transport system permease component